MKLGRLMGAVIIAISGYAYWQYIAGRFSDEPASQNPQLTTLNPQPSAHNPQPVTVEEEYRYSELRRRMVERDIRGRGVKDPVVLDAMTGVRRHLFVSPQDMPHAYDDTPLPIGHGQTISQPYIVALTTELIELKGNERVLEIGTGSGYQAAVLARIVPKVFTIEILEPLAQSALERLRRLGYANVEVRTGDGYLGWPEHAPFDAIVVTAAPDHVPQPLVEQLKPGGRMVIPVGRQTAAQELKVITKDADGRTHERSVLPVRFVPLLRK